MSLNEALVEVLTSALTTAEEAKSFVLAEMPEVVTQLLMWDMVYSLLFFSLGLFLMVVGALSTWVAALKIDFRSDADLQVFASIFGAGFCGVVVGLFVALTNLTWLQILIAPKVYLIEYAAQLIK